MARMSKAEAVTNLAASWKAGGLTPSRRATLESMLAVDSPLLAGLDRPTQENGERAAQIVARAKAGLPIEPLLGGRGAEDHPGRPPKR